MSFVDKWCKVNGSVSSAGTWDGSTFSHCALKTSQMWWPVRVLTYLWYTNKYILLDSFDKRKCCSNHWFYFIALWVYCSLHYCWITPTTHPTPLIQYFTRQTIHPYSNTCICQFLWILIIELFLFICIITSACAYLYKHRRVKIVMQSAGAQHMIQSTKPLFCWGTYCVLNLVQ